KGDPEAEGWVRGLIQGLHERRRVEGSNIRIDYRWPSENAGNMSSYAAELVDLKPDVIVAAATPALAAIAQETPSIPIVFVNVADPVGQGFVPNFARPGKASDLCDSDRDPDVRPDWHRPYRELQPSRRQRHGHFRAAGRACRQARRAVARNRAWS